LIKKKITRKKEEEIPREAFEQAWEESQKSKGALLINIIGARNLYDRSTSFLGAASPYCLVNVLGWPPEDALMSNVIGRKNNKDKASTNPQWNWTGKLLEFKAGQFKDSAEAYKKLAKENASGKEEEKEEKKDSSESSDSDNEKEDKKEEEEGEDKKTTKKIDPLKLMFQVWDKHDYFPDQFLGEAIVEIDENMIDGEVKKWVPLQNRNDSKVTLLGQVIWKDIAKGELLFSASYLPANST